MYSMLVLSCCRGIKASSPNNMSSVPNAVCYCQTADWIESFKESIPTRSAGLGVAACNADLIQQTAQVYLCMCHCLQPHVIVSFFDTIPPQISEESSL